MKPPGTHGAAPGRHHPRRSRQALLGLAVLLLHAGLFWGLARWMAPRPNVPAGATAPAIAWLLPWRPTTLPALAAAAPATRPELPQQPTRPGPARLQTARSFEALRAAPAAPAPSQTQAPAPDLAAAATSAATPAALSANTAAPAIAAAPAKAASQAPVEPLRLALPPTRNTPPSPAAWAAQDERLQPRLNRDERLAQALGTDDRLQESQRGDVRRFKQGRGCVDAAPAREAQLNPFNQSVSATPRQIRPC